MNHPMRYTSAAPKMPRGGERRKRQPAPQTTVERCSTKRVIRNTIRIRTSKEGFQRDAARTLSAALHAKCSVIIGGYAAGKARRNVRGYSSMRRRNARSSRRINADAAPTGSVAVSKIASLMRNAVHAR